MTYRRNDNCYAIILLIASILMSAWHTPFDKLPWPCSIEPCYDSCGCQILARSIPESGPPVANDSAPLSFPGHPCYLPADPEMRHAAPPGQVQLHAPSAPAASPARRNSKAMKVPTDVDPGRVSPLLHLPCAVVRSQACRQVLRASLHCTHHSCQIFRITTQNADPIASPAEAGAHSGMSCC